MSRMPRWARRSAWTLLTILALALGLAALATWAVHGSLPTLDGRVRLPGLRESLAVERDALGTAVLRGGNRLDLARGLGFVHAQERFFEMDLSRRSAAGELSALFGSVALERDKKRRVHRLRVVLSDRFTHLDANERALLQAYADGVNAGLAQLGARPWQYLLLHTEPKSWEPVDSLLVVAEMYWMLQGHGVDAGFERALLRERAGDALFDWLEPRGGSWDAPLDGSASSAPVLPGPQALDLRKMTAAPVMRTTGAAASDTLFVLDDRADRHDFQAIGSNEWAVAGSRSVSGGAMVADDMHLGLGVPSIWFRAQLEIGRGAGAIRAAGVTLPGLPAIVAGSNGSVAWGFTNAYGQWFDWIRVPAGLAPGRLTHVTEQIAVKGGADVALDVARLDGAPVALERDGRSYALRWVADMGAAYNLALDELLTARDVDAALAIARRAGMPHQNIVIADRGGHIAWTIAGRLWAESRDGHFGRFLAADAPPPQWLAPAAYPGVRDPADGQLWTANARQLGGAGGALIGDGGFDLGARAQQIRDRLSATPRFDETSLGAIQFDDEARFLRPWADRIAAVAGSFARPEVAALLKKWNGRADADQAGYTLVRAVRMRTLDALWLAWTTPLLGVVQVDDKRRLDWHGMFEYSAAQALTASAPNLLPRPYASWDAFLLAQVDASVADLTRQGQRPLAQATWGEANASHIRHVLSRAVPALSSVLDMPSRPQAGDNNMPRVAGVDFGQSERLVVSPGREEQATLSMPGGQSGHPMSPYYGAGHAAWADGRATPLLAGPAQHRLSLAP